MISYLYGVKCDKNVNGNRKYLLLGGDSSGLTSRWYLLCIGPNGIYNHSVNFTTNILLKNYIQPGSGQAVWAVGQNSYILLKLPNFEIQLTES